MREKDTAGKPGLGRRLYGWGAKRLRHPALGEVSRGAVKEAGQGAIAALKPARIDPDEISRGFRGRYADGGIARFRDMVKELGIREEDLETLRTFHALQRFLNAVSGLVSIAIGISLMTFVNDPLTRLGGLPFLIFALVFLAGYLRHDFSLWQIAHRRMDGFAAYLSARFLQR